ncbi:helix-turn-helix transcriptional regulator [Desulfoprunum benzoelyticum]|uniref:Transcriptional regulator with XRE-family HTH domain n=1 Tax=Desulfoprunum benzoelyticum TaxID=1506996 RepID=A0A840UP63_9BACT|nr:helix-turn-helix domain-containing protein [Desulfoprunum benzoelyticum]MBB5348047.1 transcriptional regulator with XRE-family HTH domain [Desulfoprunum benzoelyticum]MBM9531413.1 helix-turn-helix transcriptional regulator [Desulfoprunum benzoelyticum]
MTEYTSFSELWCDLENDELFLVEKNILEFTLQLQQLMKRKGISKKDLAEAIGTSQAYITKVFKGKANFTIATMTKLSKAIGGRVKIHVTSEEEKNPRWYRAIEGKKKVVPQWWRPDDYEKSYSQNSQGILMEQLAS